MTKSQLIEAVHKKDTGLTKVQVGQVVDAMIEAMTRAVAQDGKVEIRGFGNKIHYLAYMSVAIWVVP